MGNYLQNLKTKYYKKRPRRPVIVPQKRQSPEQSRRMLLTGLAKRYHQAIATVFAQHNIWASAPSWDVAPRYLSVGTRLHNSRDLQRAMRLTLEIGHIAGLDLGVDVVPKGGLLVYLFRLPEFYRVGMTDVRLWEDITVSHPDLGLAVGLGLYNAPVGFSFSDAAPHALVCGTSGSGKTELMKTIIYQLCMQYTPQELGIAIVDPKGDYDRFQGESHLLYQPAHMFDEIESVVHHVHAEYMRRQKHGLTTEQRIVLFVDEADQSKLLGTTTDIRDRVLDIALRGRSLRMNLVVGTHRPDADSLGDIREELSNRFLGSTATAKASGQLAGGLKLHRLAGAGDFYHVCGGTKERFQVALVLDDDFHDLNFTDDTNWASEVIVPADPELVVPSTRNAPHRPELKADPKSVAYFMYHGARSVTRAESNNALGLTRTGHNVNRNFAEAIEKAILELELAAKYETAGVQPERVER